MKWSVSPFHKMEKYVIFLSSVKRVHFFPSLYFSIPVDSTCPKSSEMLRFYFIIFPATHICYIFLVFHWYYNSFRMNPSIFNATLWDLGSRLAVFSTLIGRKFCPQGSFLTADWNNQCHLHNRFTALSPLLLAQEYPDTNQIHFNLARFWLKYHF